MQAQNQIKRTLAQPEHIEYVSRLITSNQYPNRKELAKALCRDLGFFDLRGLEQLGGCLKALRELEAAGHFKLPPGKVNTRKLNPQRLHAPVPLAVEVPPQVDQVRGLELVLVDTNEKMRIWNEMMISEHYLGAGPFVGRQLRYLIDSEHGLPGGLGFAAPALHLADRDAWIGDFRSKIGLTSKEVIAPLEVGEGLDSDQWAQNEFGDAPLGDLRLSNRLIRAAEDMSEHPGVSYSGLPGTDWAATRGYYRMIDKPDESAVCMANILHPPRNRLKTPEPPIRCPLKKRKIMYGLSIIEIWSK